MNYPGPANLSYVPAEVIAQEIEWAELQLEFQEDELERDARWYARRRALENFLRRFQQEAERRERIRLKLGSINLETADPRQASLWAR